MHGGFSPSVKLAHEWLELFNTLVKNPTKKKDFMAKHADIDGRYRELSPTEQSEFTKLIYKGRMR